MLGPLPSFSGRIFFADVYLVRGQGSPEFAGPGDSGSLVRGHGADGNAVAVGMVFAVSGDRQLTFMLPINKILGKFGVTIVGNHNV